MRRSGRARYGAAAVAGYRSLSVSFPRSALSQRDSRIGPFYKLRVDDGSPAVEQAFTGALQQRSEQGLLAAEVAVHGRARDADR